MGKQKGVCATCQQQGIALDRRRKLDHHQAYGSACDGAGDVPQAVYVEQTTQMNSLLHEGSNRIIPTKPLYYFASYGQCWYRVLMLENGHYLRVQLTPLNPTVESEWDVLLDEQIQWGGSTITIWGYRRRDGSLACAEPIKDRFTHTLPTEIVHLMHEHFGSLQADRLLTDDLWSEIESLWPTEYETPYQVTDWLGRCGYNGGLALAKIQQNPPTHAELYAAAERKRQEEREARIAAAVGAAEPLNEVERQLGMSLEAHDWAYSYSDDGEIWRRGRDHRDELERGLKALPVRRALIVWKAFVCPSNEQYWRCPVAEPTGEPNRDADRERAHGAPL